MRRSRVARWIVFSLSIGIALIGIVACIVFAVAMGWLGGTIASKWVSDKVEGCINFYRYHYEALKFAAQLFGLASAALTTTYGLLSTWHYAEWNLPDRLQDLIAEYKSRSVELRPQLLHAAAEAPDDAKFLSGDQRTTTLARFARLIRGSSLSSEARWLIKSSNDLARDEKALSSAAAEVRYRLVTAHLARARYSVARQDDVSAKAAFADARRVDPIDCEVLSCGAACARRLRESDHEVELLNALKGASAAAGQTVLFAQSLRREAEILFRRAGRDALNEARNLLAQAAEQLGSPSNAERAKRIELGRNVILFCQVQITRERTGHLTSKVSQAKEIMSAENDDFASNEDGGETYGKMRLATMLAAYDGVDPLDTIAD